MKFRQYFLSIAAVVSLLVPSMLFSPVLADDSTALNPAVPLKPCPGDLTVSFDLRGPNGADRGDVGSVLVYDVPRQDSLHHYCAVTMRGTATYGLFASLTMVAEGTHLPGQDGVKWAAGSEDTGNYLYYAGPVYITPLQGRCLSVKGSINYLLIDYTVFRNTGLCN